jgi:hypothetical protein
MKNHKVDDKLQNLMRKYGGAGYEYTVIIPTKIRKIGNLTIFDKNGKDLKNIPLTNIKFNVDIDVPDPNLNGFLYAWEGLYGFGKTEKTVRRRAKFKNRPIESKI